MIIHLVGTKAQYIKMAPVILETERRQLPCKLIYTGQHSETFDDLQKNFGLHGPDLRLTSDDEATDRQSFLKWVRSAWRAANSSAIRDIWSDASAIVVHGDTASTLLGARIAKKYGRPLVHVEAGLRSFNYLHPFPEELIRVLVSRSAAVHCCPDEVAFRNLELARVGGERLLTHGNTLIDALRIAQAAAPVPQRTNCGYGIFSMHRQENLFNKRRMGKALRLLSELAQVAPVKFVLHPVTQRRLEQLGALEQIQTDSRVTLVPRMDFFAFNALLRGASFVVTDGGSNQEECALLNIPCVLVRRATERPDGIGANAIIGDLDIERILLFLRTAIGQERPQARLPDESPSRIIVERLISFAA
jgi:UDP-N-acetylglucosamine 2-epimerase (non-hydrolysing)